MNKWHDKIKLVKTLNPIDGTKQPAMFFTPSSSQLSPLLVGLHTWSFDCFQPINYADCCIEQNWSFIYPNFRGPNWTPEAMGSELAITDIVAAVDYAKLNANIDQDRIYLLGGSGGGHAALLMAGKTPEIWAGVSAWCPITDLVKWHHECTASELGYAQHIEQAIGGNPNSDAQLAQACYQRSPVTYLENGKTIPIDIATGIHDGYTGSVPISHALEGFNALAHSADRLSRAEIDYFVMHQAVPEQLKNPKLKDELYDQYIPLFRRVSNNVRITIFEGGHDILPVPGLNWLDAQRKSSPPVWNINPQPKIELNIEDVALSH